MSSTDKSDNVRQPQSSAVKESIVRQLLSLYQAKKIGLIPIAEKLGLQLLAPRSKITVLLIGNHSAGKSSFINWYIEESLQKTGVAMETSGIVLVTSGQKREQLGGPATVQAFPFLRPLVDQAGLVNSITTQVCTSRQKRFPLVTFVDTPGLVDGEMKYAFNIEKALEWLGNAADMVVVFFDPMGQALCKRTLDIVETLQSNCRGNNQKIHFYLSKADTVEKDTDRQKVILQITQNLCRRPALNSVAFDMPTIYIPDDSDPIKSRVPNQINDLCEHIDHTINSVVQTSLNQFQRDCNLLLETIDRKLDQFKREREQYWNRLFWALSYMALALTMALVASAALTHKVWPQAGRWAENRHMNAGHRHRSGSMVDSGMLISEALEAAHTLMALILELGGTSLMHKLGALAVYVLVLLLLFYRSTSLLFRPTTLSASQARELSKDRKIVDEILSKNYKSLYDAYLGDAVGDDRTI